MSGAMISGCGKLNTNGGGESNLSYLNIIDVPVENSDANTRFLFFSKQEVNNINDLVDVLNFYKSYKQPIILVAGDFVKKGSSPSTFIRYSVVDIFESSTHYATLTYRKTSTDVGLETLFKIGGTTPPTNWIFTNIKF